MPRSTIAELCGEAYFKTKEKEKKPPSFSGVDVL